MTDIEPTQSPSTVAPAPPPPEPSPPSSAKDGKPSCGVAPPEDLERWVDQASAALVFVGESPIIDRAAVLLIIRYESSGNPCVVNDWDSNAAAGTPSKGLIQAIQPTFDRWSLPGYGDPFHPVDSIVAGVRYARGRYGSESSVPGVLGVRAGRGYVGY
ncbi:MAG: transglycosylase SLT domain-containing protein [Umezawaea sp.]